MSLSCAPAATKKEHVMEVEEGKGPVVLTGEVKQDKDNIVISYELKNQSHNPVLAWDLMSGEASGSETIIDDLAYVCFEEPKTLRVVRGVLPLPLDRDVYQKEIPYARTIEPMSSVTGRIVLPLPLEEYNPYYEPTVPENEKEVEIREIRLLIAWTETQSGMVVSDADVGGKKVKMIRGAWEGPLQRLAEVTFPAHSMLKIRTDVFDRRMPQK
jgi:hypothetical protein